MQVLKFFVILLNLTLIKAEDLALKDEVVCRVHEELLTYYQRFWDAFLFPGGLTQLKAVNSSLLAEDVIGRVDVTRTYIGRELNTEYLFGSFSDNTFHPEVTTLLGAPLSHQTTRFATQGYLLSSSELILFNASLFGDVIPVEVHMWMLFNRQGEIKQYDITFRWFAWLFQDIINLVESTASSMTEKGLLQQLAQEVCQTALKYCTGSMEQYSSHDQCQQFLSNQIRMGAPYEFGRNTLLCRHLHAKILPLRPETHCPHIGPTGGDMCVDDLTYQEVLLQPFFHNDEETTNCVRD